MAAYNKTILTNAGLQLLGDALTGDEIEFVSLSIGSGNYTAEEKKTDSIRNMTSLKICQQTVFFSLIKRVEDNQVLLKANLSNDNLKNGYLMTEIGIMARKKGTEDAILYSVITTEESDYFPCAEDGRYSIIFNINVNIGDVENVSIVFQKETYALAEDLADTNESLKNLAEKNENHIADKDNPHSVTKKQVGLENVDNTADVNKVVSTLQREAIDEAYRQSNLYTDTKIGELINGAPSTLDTLKEIADAMSENEDVVEALDEAIGVKADQAELDGHTGNNTIHITADERAGIMDAVDKKHTHSNKSILDGITSALVDAWNDANTKKHEHTNKTILDSTTASYTTEEKEKLSGIKDGAETTAAVTSGNNPTVTNSTDAQLIYGKIVGYTVQDGVPTPDSPIDIQGLGNSGSVEVKTCGKNLLTHSLMSGTVYGLTTKLNDDGSLTFTGTTTNQITHHLDDIISRLKVGETYIWSGVTNVKIVEDGTNLYKSGGGSYTITENTTAFIPYFQWGADATLNTTYYPMVRIKGTDDSYEPYAETTATIPIDAPFYDGDYIEVYADGSGKIMRTMGSIVYDGSTDEDWQAENTATDVRFYIKHTNIKRQKDIYNYPNVKCNILNIATPADTWTGITGATAEYNKFIIRLADYDTLEDFISFIQSTPVKFVYELATPVETELTAEHVAQFKKLYTFDNVTNFFCDGEITARYYVNTDSGDTVGMLHKSISELQEVDEGNALVSYFTNDDLTCDVTGSLDVFRHRLSENTYLLNINATLTKCPETYDDILDVNLTLQDLGFGDNIVTARDSQCSLASEYPLLINGTGYGLCGGTATVGSMQKGFYLTFLPHKNVAMNKTFLSGTMLIKTMEL